MTEFVRRAAFLRDVQVGDRWQWSAREEPPWLVTGREVTEIEDFMTGKTRTLVVLIGQDDQGEPKTATGAPWVPVIIHVPVQAPERSP
jgi:hypothetical protein